MRSCNLIFAALTGALLAAGCNRAESPADDTAATAQQPPADASQDREQLAQNDPYATSPQSVPQETTGSPYDIAIDQAETSYKAAMESCVKLPTEEQQVCKDRADDELATAKSRAESLRTGETP